MSALAGRRDRLATALGAGGAIVAAVVGLVPVIESFVAGAPADFHARWDLPLASFALGLDPLSAWFAAAVLGLSGVAALYGVAYVRESYGRRNVGVQWCAYDFLVLGMLLVVTARNGVLFLVAWEVMALASYLLVVVEDEREDVRRAGWTYLVATHVGTAFLLALFLLLGGGAETLDFSAFESFAAAGPTATGAAFLLALVGFGTKAGFVPLHVWLPEAHPAAPSHVSAVMSGVMIKTGIYGLLRILTFLGEPPLWWGVTLVGVGVASGLLGVLFALAQHDLKRLLAYHSVENIGIIALGIGIGLLGRTLGSPVVSVLGFAGALLHVVNHALFKGLLFLGAGAVRHATGTLSIDALGGLLRRMPTTGALFLLGAAAISGLPPLNGFVSEFLIYVGAFRSVAGEGSAGLAVGVVVVMALALIGGLAAACFAKAFGIVFLGEPRSEAVAHAHEAPRPMRAAMAILAAGCVAIGLAGPAVAVGVAPVAAGAAGLSPAAAESVLPVAAVPLGYVTLGAGLLLVLFLGLVLLRRALLRGRPVESAGTWGCGYVAPDARMQYTSSSFAQPLVDLAAGVLRSHTERTVPTGLFPKAARFERECDDSFIRFGYGPLFGVIARAMARLRSFQHGQVQLYVLYVALTLFVLLVWKLG